MNVVRRNIEATLLFVFVVAVYLAVPMSVQAYVEINSTGGGCAFVGEWDASQKTCSLSSDVFEPIRITGPTVTLDGRGYLIDVSDISYEDYAVRVDGALGVTVKNLNTIGGGIYFNAADGGQVINNAIVDSHIGINFFNLGGAQAEGNVITGTANDLIGVAINAQDVDNLTLQHNRVTQAARGMQLTRVVSSIVTQNHLSDTILGMELLSVTDSVITGNLLSGLETALSLQADASERTVIQGNTFTNSTVAVTVRAETGGGGPAPTFTQTPASHDSSVVAARAGLKQLFKAVSNALMPTVLAQVDTRNVFFQNNFINNDKHVDIVGWVEVLFARPLPEGGNYWDTFDEAGEGCVDSNMDGTCDTPYELSGLGFSDEFPKVTLIVHELPQPQCSDGIDNDSDGLIDFPADPGCTAATDFIEVNPPAPTCTLVADPASIDEGERTMLHWTSTNAANAEITRLGTVDTNGEIMVQPDVTTTYAASFSGGGGETVCSVTVTVQTPQSPTLGEQAAELAKLVVTAPYLGDGDTYGGKGWDPVRKMFVSPEDIFEGYTFWNNKLKKNDFAAGLDCSGLVMWSFNRANSPTISHKNNIVLKEGADGQYRENIEPAEVAKEDLKPGDLLFYSRDGNPDHFKDHVAMYVGGEIGFEIVEARSPAAGIVQSSLEDRSSVDNFINEFRRFKPAVSPMVQVEVASPVDLIVTDPDGITISPDTFIQTNSEYLREVPGEWYYSEMIQGSDGRPADWVYSYNLKDGVYRIQALPDETATSGSSYSLTFTTGDATVELAKDELVSTIPSQGFAVAVSDDGETITEIEPVQDTTILFEMLRAEVKTADIRSRWLDRRLQRTVRLAERLHDRGRTRAAIAVLKKLQRITDRRSGRGINADDAVRIYDTADQLIAQLKYERKGSRN